MEKIEMVLTKEKTATKQLQSDRKTWTIRSKTSLKTLPRAQNIMAAAKSVTVSIDKLSPSTPSLCIPRVFPNITWQRVKDALEDVGLGEIERVDMVHKKNEKGESFKRVFVHFKRWATTPEATAAREMVLGGDMFQVTYDDPWFWKIGMSHAEKPERRTATKKTVHKKKTRPQLSIRATPKKITHTAETQKASDAAELRKMIEEQRRELETLRAALAETTAPTTPAYAPSTPPGSPPVLNRQIATDHGHSTCGTYDHIAREIAEEFEEFEQISSA